MTTFLVDDLRKDKLGGMTYSVIKVIHNLKLIGLNYHDNFMEELKSEPQEAMIQICALGRYMTIIQMSKDKKKAEMIFMDTRNDYNMALDITNMIKADPPELKVKYTNIFMEEFVKMSPYYDNNYNQVGLSLDNSFLN